MNSKIRILLVLACVVALAVAVAAGVGASAAVPASQPLHSCIPQHNRGDHDRDNRGGRNDHDGCR